MSDTTERKDLLAEDEDPELRRAQQAGVELLASLHSITRVLMLYEPNNTAVVRLLDSLEKQLQGYFTHGADQLQLQLLEDEFFVDGKLLKLDSAMWERATDVSKTLARFELGEFTFGRECGRATLDGFVQGMAECLRTGENQFPKGGLEQLGLGKTSGRSIASFRFQPDRLGIWLYAGLLDVVERLYSEYAEGRTPSLLPVRRLLQLLIDSARSLGGLFQVLATMRDPAREMTLPRVRVAMAVDSVGFGIFLGLRNTELMTLALSALLGALSDSTDPELAVEPLFSYPGLGSAAMVLILAVHDTRLALQGAPAGVPGRMMATTEIFHRLTSSADEPEAPTTALRSMLGGEIQGCDVSMAKLFASYKGMVPLGAPVVLSDRRGGIVLSQGDSQASKRRPVIGIIVNGRLTERVDMAKHADLKIVSTPTALQSRLDLTKLRSELASA